jgi:hypothetical protein
MKMFRAMTKDGKEVFGWLVKSGKSEWIVVQKSDGVRDSDGQYWFSFYIYDGVFPETIAMKTGQTDKNGTMIYGSFELEGFGMTKGGDILSDGYDYCFVVYDNIDSCWVIDNQRTDQIRIVHYVKHLEIIGKQYKET